MKFQKYFFLLIVISVIITPAVYAASYSDNGVAITDNITTLMWQKQDDGTAKTWEDAIVYCEALTLGGYTDWRLPQIKELNSLVDTSRSSPAINAIYFPGTQSLLYWSSTTNLGSTTGAWAVDFSSGIMGSSIKTGNNYVRCVR